MNDNFMRDYTELKNNTIDLKEKVQKRKVMGKGDESTVLLEQQIQKSLESFKKKLDTVLKGYTEKYKQSLDQIEASRRINMLNELDKVYKSYKTEFDQIIDTKYKFVSIFIQKISIFIQNYDEEKYNNYHSKEEFGLNTNKELLNKAKEKNKNQDDQILGLVGVAREGNVLAKDIGSNLEKQNVKLENLSNDMDEAETNMSKTRKKFEDFIDKSSYCCLWILIIVFIVTLALIIILI